MKCNGQRAAGLLFTIILIAAITLGWGSEAMGKYLTVDEQATYNFVTADGWELRAYFGDNETSDLIYIDASTSFFLGNNINSGYETRFDRDRIATVIENTPLRVVIKLVANFENTSQTDLDADSGPVTIYYVVYPDKLIVHTSWVLTGDVYIISHTDNCIHEVDDDGTFTNSLPIAEISGVEKYHEEDGSGDPDLTRQDQAGDYCGVKADEVNLHMVTIAHTDSASYRQRMHDTHQLRYGWDVWGTGVTLTTGTHTDTVAIFIDSADRENDGGTFNDWDTDVYDGDVVLDPVPVGYICNQAANGLRYYCHTSHTPTAGAGEPPNTDYWWEYRMTLGDQYKDLVMAAPTTGSEVTDLVIPLDLSSDGFATDGGRHLEMASDEIEYTVDENRIGHVEVLEDPPIETGTVGSATDHLIEHIKADDNAASSVVVATVGNNGVWQAADETGRNTSNESISTDIDRGTGLDTTDTYLIDHSVTVYDNAYFKQGTKQIWFTPQFGYDDGADQTIWSLYVDAGDYIQITYDAGNDRYELRVSWGGTLATLNGSAYTESDTLQQLTFIQAAWDSDENLCQLVINGQVVDNDTNTGTPSASNAAYVMTGADCVTDADGTAQLPADIYIGDSKAIDGMLRNEGAYFTGNGAVSVDHAHEDILFFYGTDDITSPTSEIGSTSITVNGTSLVAGPFGANQAVTFNAGTDDINWTITGSNFNKAKGAVAFWMAPGEASSASQDKNIFSINEDLTSNSRRFRLWMGQNQLRVYVENGEYYTFSLTTAEQYSADEWVFVVVAYDKDGIGDTTDISKVKMSLKGLPLRTGSLSGSVPFAEIPAANDTFVLGTYQSSATAGGFDGAISKLYCLDDPNTPQIPVILGSGPIHAPIQGIE